MIWRWVKNIFLFPIIWFWEQYQKCKEDNAVGKMIVLFAFSLTGLVVIGVALGILVDFIINKATEQPESILIITGVIWIYLYGRSKYLKGEQQNAQMKEQQKQDLKVQNENAQKGYPSIKLFMYVVLKNQCDDIDCEKPLSSDEIQMPEEKYILKNNVCFYQFRLKKKDRKLYDRETLDVFKHDIQYTIQTKLHSGENLTFDAQDIHDQYGNIFDAIVIDSIEDMGGFFQFSVVYASQIYAELVRNRQMMQNNDSAGELAVSWDNKS